MLDLVRLAVGHDDVGHLVEDRGDQVRDALARVLVVPVGVDEDVGAHLQGLQRAVLEGLAQTHVAGVVDEVAHPEAAGHLHRGVGAPVVDDQVLDLVDARDLLRHLLEHQREGLLLVETRDLDHEFHRRDKAT
ncbi:MAG TPA: hypothetical protein VFH58_13825 [Acidimicrobiales bacterium]|nr:hypothetical protein [Acidimicrobiales bacterium]